MNLADLLPNQSLRVDSPQNALNTCILKFGRTVDFSEQGSPACQFGCAPDDISAIPTALDSPGPS